MSKTKANGVKAAKPEKDVLSKVKAGGITKPVAAAKSKGKELAKAIATEDSKSKKQKKVKEPTPESESDSEASEEEESEESSESESEDESESEAAPVTNGKALKGKAKPAPASDSEDSDSSEESDDEEPAAVAEASSADESESDSDESAESEDEKPAAAAAVKKAKKVDDDDSEDASEDSDDSSDDAEEDSSEEESDEEEEEAKPVSKKRKAEDESPFAAKKNKAEAEASTSQGTNLFVGNLSWNIDEDWLSREFGEYGELSGVRIVYDRQSGRSKGFGYVEYVNAADAGKAYAARKDTDLDNRRINLDWASGRNNAGGAGGQERAQSRAKSFGDSTSPASDTLFVGNISFEADQDSVSEAFGEYGTITGVRLPTDRETGAPKGFGYVTFSSVEEATAAFEAMQGYNLSGRSLRLDYSTPRPSNGDSPRGGRGGFGGGRGGFGGRGGGRGGFGDRGGRGGARGGRGGARGGRGGTTNRGGFGDFSGKKTSFD